MLQLFALCGQQLLYVDALPTLVVQVCQLSSVPHLSRHQNSSHILTIRDRIGSDEICSIFHPLLENVLVYLPRSLQLSSHLKFPEFRIAKFGRRKLETSLYGMVYFEPFRHDSTSVTNRRTDRQHILVPIKAALN